MLPVTNHKELKTAPFVAISCAATADKRIQIRDVGICDQTGSKSWIHAIYAMTLFVGIAFLTAALVRGRNAISVRASRRH